MPTKRKILAITSDPVLINILESGLGPDGYEIVGVPPTDKDLKYTIDCGYFDFIFQDIMMPSLDGIGSCLQTRQWTQTPIILLTTWETSGGNLRGLDLNAPNYLTEPFNTEILKLRIRETMKRNSIAAAHESATAHQTSFERLL